MKTGTIVTIVIIVVVILALGGLYWYFTSSNNQTSYQEQNTTTQTQPTNTQTTTNSQPAINNDQQLMSASQSLDSTDTTQIDSTLNQNTNDSKSFAPRIRNKDGTSTNWSGYAVETNITNPQSNAVSDVKGNWVVPAVTCTGTNTYSSAWIGIDGYSDNTVEQTGTEQDCVNGNSSYYAWYEMYPKSSFRVGLAVHAGDTMSAEVHYVGGKKFQLTLTDTTTKQTFTTTQNSNGQRQSAEWIMEAPWSGGVLPLANFGTIPFSNASATLNNVTGTISNWQNDQINMVNSSGALKATTSSLSLDGSAFSVSWNNSN